MVRTLRLMMWVSSCPSTASNSSRSSCSKSPRVTVMENCPSCRPLAKSLPPKPTPELPLYGVPFAIKDNIDLAETTTTAGCPDFVYLPSKSATVVERLIAAGIRVEFSEANESLGKRIRAAEMMKIPYLLVVGEKEEGGGTVNVRDRKGEEKEVALAKFIKKIEGEIKEKTL